MNLFTFFCSVQKYYINIINFLQQIKSHLINLQIEGVETSDDLYNVLYDAFYKNNLFSPNINKLKKIYSEDEIRNILEDSEIQGRVKETIEKLRQTEEFTIPQIKYNKDFDVRSSKVNIIGQYKKQNPLKLEQQVKEQDYVKVPVVNEAGEQLETQLMRQTRIDLAECLELLEAVSLGTIGLLRDGLSDKRVTLNGFATILPFSLSALFLSYKSLLPEIGFYNLR